MSSSSEVAWREMIRLRQGLSFEGLSRRLVEGIGYKGCTGEANWSVGGKVFRAVSEAMSWRTRPVPWA